jgi:hypothetical protein
LPEDNSAAVCVLEDQALILGMALVDGVVVFENATDDIAAGLIGKRITYFSS